jgi:hypothetical protein
MKSHNPLVAAQLGRAGLLGVGVSSGMAKGLITELLAAKRGEWGKSAQMSGLAGEGSPTGRK